MNVLLAMGGNENLTIEEKKKCRNGVKDSLSLGSEGGYVKFGVVPLSRPPADSSHTSHDSRFSFSHTFFFFGRTTQLGGV